MYYNCRQETVLMGIGEKLVEEIVSRILNVAQQDK